MSDAQTQTPAPATPANFTRAGVTGKVPMAAKPRGRARKPAKLSASQRRHVGTLKKSGVISQAAAAAHKI